jgi:hypothetical protein
MVEARTTGNAHQLSRPGWQEIHARGLRSSPWTTLYPASFLEPRVSVMGIGQIVCFHVTGAACPVDTDRSHSMVEQHSSHTSLISKNARPYHEKLLSELD